MRRHYLPGLDLIYQTLHYDPETGHLIHKGLKRRVGYVHGRYRAVNVQSYGYPEHRLIWYMQTRVDPQSARILHRNGDGHDNRWKNLQFLPHPGERYEPVPLPTTPPPGACLPPPTKLPCATTSETNKVSTFGTLQIMRSPNGTLTFTPRTRGLILKRAQQQQRLSA